MNKYETIFVANPQLEEDALKALIEKFKSLIEQYGQLEKVEEWGKKRLAYEVQDQKEGSYVLMHFQSEPDFPTELERNYKISDAIMKYLTVRRDEK